MDQHTLSQWLADTFDDLRLDNSEKQSLRELSAALSPDLRRFARNRAFDLARDALTSGTPAISDVLRWLEQVIKTLDSATPEPARSSAHFSPGDACRGAILDCLQQARRTVDICIFTLSDDRIAEAVLKTHGRGVAVRIISDDDKTNDAGSDIDRLRRQGVPVRIDNTPYHMHHKFALFDGEWLLNGSFNWTRSASEQNEENILLTTDSHLVTNFAQQFEDMWERFA